MSTMLPDGYDEVSHHELAFIRTNGVIDIWGYGYQPTTNDIADRAFGHLGRPKGAIYTHVVQKIGNMYEVYDLKSPKKITLGASDYTIGLPIASHSDVDAAIMSAILLA